MNKNFCSLGLMSGTSMDGVDASIIKSNGKGQFNAILNRYFECNRHLLIFKVHLPFLLLVFFGISRIQVILELAQKVGRKKLLKSEFKFVWDLKKKYKKNL